jgi:SAM-dependent methyltransferase
MQPEVFDTYAFDYDIHFTNSLIGKEQRLQVHKHVSNNAYFFNKHVLEVNCGTGEDALWLAKQQATVLATDVSSGMLSIARKKAANENIEFKQMSAQSIGTLAPERYNYIFSNFGGLNCLSENEMIQFENGCEKLQGYDDQLVFVIMGTKCLWERYFFIRKGDKEKAYRRSNKNGVETVIDSHHFKTYYYSPREIKSIFKKNYYHTATKPIGLFVPPSYLESYFVKRKGLFGFLKLLDKILGNFSFLANYADHYLIVLKRK